MLRGEPSLETGRPAQRKRRRLAAFGCGFTSVVAAMVLMIGCGEVYRHEVDGVVRAVARVMADRESPCLSSVHVGRDDYRILVLAARPNASAIALINPSIFQVVWGASPPVWGAKPPRPPSLVFSFLGSVSSFLGLV